MKVYLLYKIGTSPLNSQSGLSRFIMIAHGKNHLIAMGILDQILYRVGIIDFDGSIPTRTIAMSVNEHHVGEPAYDLKQCEYDYSFIPELNKVEKKKRGRK